jgi:hypothetical protein
MFIFHVYSIFHVRVCVCVHVSDLYMFLHVYARVHRLVFVSVCVHAICVFVTAHMCLCVCMRTYCACLWFTVYSVPACARFDDWHVTFVNPGCLYVLLIHEIVNACILLET